MYYSRKLSTIAAGLGIAGYLLLATGFVEAQIVQLGVPPGNSYPVTISASGSYELIANLVAPDSVDAIDINADNVTLNLNGFSITTSGAGRGIGIVSGNNNTVVSNGIILGLVTGIYLGDNCKVRNVQILGSSGDFGAAGGSLRCGAHSAVEDVLVDNGGVAVGAGSRIKNSTLVGGHNVATNSNNPALICPSGCLATEDIFEQGAVKLGSSGYADSFLGAGASAVGGVNSDSSWSGKPGTQGHH
jgi:hypothetical protein